MSAVQDSGSGGSLQEPRVVCPHCWLRFYRDEAKFIATHPTQYGDAVLGDQQHRRVTKAELVFDRDGVAFDPAGGRVTERACPVCHYQIPPDVLAARPLFLSVAGAPRSGKTYFITSMLHWLRHDLSSTFGYAFKDSDSHDVRVFLEYERTLFHSKNPGDPTFLKKTEEQGDLYKIARINGENVQLPRPFIFEIRTAGAQTPATARQPRSLVVYDNAGESFDFLKEQETNSRVTQHLTESDAILFAYDPLQEARAQEALARYSNDPQLTVVPSTQRQEQTLGEVVNRIRRHQQVPPEQRLTMPLCICVQKYDVWKPFLQHRWSEKNVLVEGGVENPAEKSPLRYFPKQGVGGLNMDSIHMMSSMVRQYCEELNPQLVSIAESNFSVVRYFAVSALGTSPECEQNSVPTSINTPYLKVRPNQIKPYRVTIPALWVLQMFGLIHRTQHRTDLSQLYPNATIELSGAGRIRVTSPVSKAIMEMDPFYAPGLIVDPHSGEVIWLPEPPSEGGDEAPADQPSESPVTDTSVESLRLSLQGSRRKGWFR